MLGIVLFAWFVREAGAVEIWNKVRQVGWGLPIIIAIAGLRFGARAVAWSVCIEPPYALPVTEAFAGVVCGDAFGNLTPLGPIVGEPAKAAYVRRTIPLGPALTALAIENLIYTISVVAMIAAAMIALIFYFPLPAALVETSEILIGTIVGGLLIALLVLWRRPTLISSTLGKLLPSGSPMQTRVEAIRAIEEQIHGFAIRRRGAAIIVAVAELVFHALGVLEVYVTWWMMMGTAPSVLTCLRARRSEPPRHGRLQDRSTAFGSGRNEYRRLHAVARIRHRAGRHTRHHSQGPRAVLDPDRHHPSRPTRLEPEPDPASARSALTGRPERLRCFLYPGDFVPRTPLHASASAKATARPRLNLCQRAGTTSAVGLHEISAGLFNLRRSEPIADRMAHFAVMTADRTGIGPAGLHVIA